MEEGHYDTPWEFKNRAIAAALSANANANANANSKYGANSGGDVCQMKASTSSEENIPSEMLPSYYENEKRHSANGNTRMSSLTSKTPSPPQTVALNTAKNGNNRSQRSISSVLRKSASNVYADDPLAAKQTENCCPFPSPSSTAVPAKVSYAQHFRRFSTNSGENFPKQINLHHHYPSVCPAQQHQIFAHQQQQQDQQHLRQNDAVTPLNRNRFSCDEMGAKKTSPNALRSAHGFHTPSTSSSSSGSPFLATSTANQPPSSFSQFSPSPTAANAKANAREKYLETYPLVGGNGISCCCGCGVDAAVSHHKKTKTTANLSIPPRYPGHNPALVSKARAIDDAGACTGGGAQCLTGEENCGAANFNHYGARRFFDEANMIHDCMERVDAERILKPLEVGDFLLRKRNEGNLALSLRSTDGILHIKLEMRDGCWVLGEGPRFPTVAGVLRCYRKTELPVRGAEHVRLRSPVTLQQLKAQQI